MQKKDTVASQGGLTQQYSTMAKKIDKRSASRKDKKGTQSTLRYSQLKLESDVMTRPKISNFHKTEYPNSSFYKTQNSFSCKTNCKTKDNKTVFLDNSQKKKGHKRKDVPDQDSRFNQADDEINALNFLRKISNEGTGGKNQFYMTQVINHQQKLGGACQNKPIKSLKGAESAQRTKKKTTNASKSLNYQNFEKQHQSPSTAQCKDTNVCLDETGEKIQSDSRSFLNHSALHPTMRKDALNATAPVSFLQFFGRTNCSRYDQNGKLLKHVVSKKKPTELNIGGLEQKQHLIQDPQLSGLLNVSPIKQSTKKGFNNYQNYSKGTSQLRHHQEIKQQKQFLNLTLQKLIQEQKKSWGKSMKLLNNTTTGEKKNTDGDQNNVVASKDKNYTPQLMEDFKHRPSSSKRLNKTFDSQSKQKKGHSHLKGNPTNNYLDLNAQMNQILKNEMRQPKKSNFSNTAKSSDFNQTQIFANRPSSKQRKPSKDGFKSSLKMNLNGDSRKPSALSVHSTNTCATNNKIKQKRKAFGESQAKPSKVATSKSQPRKKPSIDQNQEFLSTLFNFYQHEINKDLTGNTQASNHDRPQAIPQQSLTGEANKKPQLQDLENQKNLLNATMYMNSNKRQLKDFMVKPDPQKLNQTFSKPSKGKKSLPQDYKKASQNKTQPLPSNLLAIANAEAANLSAGTLPISDLNKDDIQGHRGTQEESIGIGEDLKLSKFPALLTQHEEQTHRCLANHYCRNDKRKTKQNVNSKIQKLDQRQQRYKGESQKPKLCRKKDVEVTQIKQRQPEENVYQDRQLHILDASEEDFQIERESNQTKLDQYVFGREIGQGAYAVVRVATFKKENKRYAIKIYDKSKLTDSNRQRSVRRELRLLQKMDHPFIVKLHDAFETNQHVYLVMDYVNRGSLYSYLKERSDRRLDEEEAKRIMRQLVTALQYCHKKSITHRDIKLENILLDDQRNVKIIDFGFSTCIPNDKKIKMFCGTPSYMGPEIVARTEYAGPPADIWASAVLLYALMNGCFPFRGSSDKELYRRIQRGAFTFHNQGASNELLDLLSRMLNVDPDDRLTADEVLEDVWFTTDNKSSQLTKKQKIANAKQQFKEKILAKAPVRSQQDTICLQATKKDKLHKKDVKAVGAGQVQIWNMDISDYGDQQHNQTRKLNQDAYQAYQNTTASSGLPGSQHNPYFNNFFKGHFSNTFQSFKQNQLGLHNNQARISPRQQFQNNSGYDQVFSGHQVPNIVGTPQVQCSPSGIQCNGKIISNNFNIVNNITQVVPCSQTQKEGLQHNQQQCCSHLKVERQTPQGLKETTMLNSSSSIEIDEEIVDSITKLGYLRSHVVSQLESDAPYFWQIYSRLQEEKSSRTNGRTISSQAHSRRHQSQPNHNKGVSASFTSSLPESSIKQTEDQVPPNATNSKDLVAHNTNARSSNAPNHSEQSKNLNTSIITN